MTDDTHDQFFIQNPVQILEEHTYVDRWCPTCDERHLFEISNEK